MSSVLLKHGYQMVGGEIKPKPYRPKTVGDAKRMIEKVFEKNKWDDRDRRVYLSQHDVRPKEVHALSVEESRIILNAMERSHLILFQN